jgi:hypothetical protein
VPSADEVAAGGDDVTVDAQGRVRRAPADVEIEYRLFREST